MSEPSVEAQLRKLQARRSELPLQSLFLPPAQRIEVALWYALQDEIEEACFELSEPFIAQTKLAWWAEELARGCAGQGRHPLVQALFGQEPVDASDQSALWRALPEAALHLVERDLAPASVAEALASLQPLAAALDALERSLFGGATASGLIAVDLLLRRQQRAEAGHFAQARLPRNLLARHGLAPAHFAERERLPARLAFVRDLAGELRAALPVVAEPLARPRALQIAVAQWRLARLSREGRVPAPRGFPLMFSLWRAARHSAPMPVPASSGGALE